MKQTLIYTTKIFTTTALFGPAVLVALLAAYKPSTFNGGDMTYILLAVPIGLILCVPSWLLLWWLTNRLSKLQFSIACIKTWLSLACVPLSVLPFGLMNYRTVLHPNYWPDLAPWVCTYAAITIAGIWFYELQPFTSKPSVTKI